MAPIIKIALCQFEPKDCDVQGNFRKAMSLFPKENEADICILPEFHLTSWCPSDPEFLAATREASTYLASYQEQARKLNINIVPGTICEVIDSADGEDFPEIRNMSYFIEAGTGNILASYQKKNLWHPERPHLTAGTELPHQAFDTPFRWPTGAPVRAGLLVCWDLAFPEAFRELVVDGAQLILIPAYWGLQDVDKRTLALDPTCEIKFIESTVTARAFENTAAVVFCNAFGLSRVAMPIVGTQGARDWTTEGVRVLEIDLEVLEVAEENYKVRHDVLAEGWHYARTLEARASDGDEKRDKSDVSY